MPAAMDGGLLSPFCPAQMLITSAFGSREGSEVTLLTFPSWKIASSRFFSFGFSYLIWQVRCLNLFSSVEKTGKLCAITKICFMPLIFSLCVRVCLPVVDIRFDLVSIFTGKR